MKNFFVNLLIYLIFLIISLLLSSSLGFLIAHIIGFNITLATNIAFILFPFITFIYFYIINRKLRGLDG